MELRSSIIVISYHFYPSNEVGARRVTSLSRYLAEHGADVYVVSKFRDGTAPDLAELHPRLRPVPVPEPSRPVLAWLVATKRVLTGGGRAVKRPGRGAGDTTPGSGGVRRSGRLGLRRAAAKVRNAFFRVVLFVDEHKRWSWHASRAAYKLGRQTGAVAVFSSGPPLSMIMGAARAARRLGIPFIADMRDPWTDSPTKTGRELRSLESRLLAFLERRTFQSAALLVCVTPGIANAFIARTPSLSPKTHVIMNGCDEEPRVLPDDTGNALRMLFAGEIYANRDPFPFLEALDRLLSRSDVDGSRVSVTLVGHCETYRDVRLADWMAGRPCERVVRILPPVGPQAVSELMKEATVLLNLAQRQPLQIPAKTFEYVVSGREQLVLCEEDSDTARIVAGIRGVVQVDPANTERLDAALSDLYERHVVRGRLTAPTADDTRRFSRTALNRRYSELLAESFPALRGPSSASSARGVSRTASS